MNIEYGNYDIAQNENEFKENLIQALKYDINIVSVLPSFLKLAKTVVKDSAQIACVIDYPYGILDSEQRNQQILSAIRSGAKIIEVVIPSYYLCNRKYEKLKNDIQIQQQSCSVSGVEIRYILEYRVFSLDVLCRATQSLFNNYVTTIIPSTGQLIDDVNDNLIASAMLQKKVPAMKIVNNGNLWTDKHAELIISNSPYAFRCYNINGLDRLRSKLRV